MYSSQPQTIQEKITEYESFVNDKLKIDLKTTLDLRDEVYEQLSEYLKLKRQIQLIQENSLHKMKTMVDLGSNFYVHAKIPDTSYIYVNVGFGFHVQFTLDEAIEFINKKEKLLERKADQYSKTAAKINAHIAMVLEAINEILSLKDDKDKNTNT
ncbi:9338_t:CDS:2 [Paraglomus occultum]|uniref:9338_t:CDS:1 n=1 Tax=Paraglomus occultum TaxID=144539 RepID=A0A9N9G111_9GLOM|nr:9338_t:CDS:2 [Paraglomus occultum]